MLEAVDCRERLLDDGRERIAGSAAKFAIALDVLSRAKAAKLKSPVRLTMDVAVKAEDCRLSTVVLVLGGEGGAMSLEDINPELLVLCRRAFLKESSGEEDEEMCRFVNEVLVRAI